VNILLDVHHLGLRHTGNETWARNVLLRIPELLPDQQVRFAVGAPGAGELSMATDSAYDLVSTSSGVRLLRDLPRLCHRHSVDVVFTQYTPALTRRPKVVLIHDISPAEPGAREWIRPADRYRYLASFKAAARFAHTVLTVSQFTKTRLMDRYGLRDDQVRLAGNALDPVLRSELSSRQGKTRLVNVVLAVGNVLPRKNLAVVAEAIAILNKTRRVPLSLRVVGQVPDDGKATAEHLVAVLGDRVEFTGYVSIQKLADEYRNASVLVFPSRYEGFGIPLLEAMSADLPTVVSDRGALPEVAGSAALVVPANDPIAWAKAVSAVLDDDSLRDRLVGAGRIRAAEFDWDRPSRVVAETLLEAANEAGADKSGKRHL
jgi:glycosyltransferase involved in cell wall biosynthesis